MTEKNQDIALWTVGHSTRSQEEFGQLLTIHAIKMLVDVRSFPSSRRHPQFNREALAASLKSIGVSYLHLRALGGRRPPKSDSRNTALTNAGFRAYADYMETEAFREGVEELLELAARQRTVIMCAEAVWWRCHRSLIADFVKAEGFIVQHIIDAKRVESHPYSPAARIVNGELSYRALF